MKHLTLDDVENTMNRVLIRRQEKEHQVKHFYLLYVTIGLMVKNSILMCVIYVIFKRRLIC